ncbi:MAG: hypothetical protein MUE75_02215 [Algoriphagus sp.]|jgi:hypothetical protein|nr:hypothetical protein [Algoriphagus sp.]
MSQTPASTFQITGQILFFLSMGSVGFWSLFKLIDIYQIGVLGAVYELLWLPFLALAFGIPTASFYFWAKSKFKLNSLFLYAFLISSTLLGWMIVVEG